MISVSLDRAGESMDIAEQEELIFGKNAVLAFLTRAAEDADQSEKEPLTRDVMAVLNKLKADSVQPDRIVPDLKKLQRLPKVKVNKILIAESSRPDPRLHRIAELARKNKIPVQPCDRRKLDQLVGPQRRHQGVVALISPADIWQLDTFLQKVEIDRISRELAGQSMDGYTLAILDGVEDPHNLGAIIRVAEAAGVKAILIPQHRSAGLTGIVAKISAGAVASLPVVRVSNLVQALETLKKYGFWIAGMDASADQEYTEADLVRPLALVIGSEGTGMARLVREHCDMLLKIPMLGRTESLNASVAAGIIFYEVVRQTQSHHQRKKSEK